MRPFEFIYIFEVLKKLIPYIPITLYIAIATMFYAIVFGFLLFEFKKSKNKLCNYFANMYIYLMRCTPTIVLLFIIYYGLPKVLVGVFDVDINGFDKSFFVIVSLTMIFSASMAEIIRSAYENVDIGQYEASISIGLSKKQTYVRILIPQMIVYALPNLGNSLIALLKEGAIAYTIGLIDIMGQGNLIIARNYGAYALETYIALTLIYWSFTFLFDKIFFKLEVKLDKNRLDR
ncbi:MAG: amino acid ABC transporter permease [Lachnospirales bacterium]